MSENKPLKRLILFPVWWGTSFFKRGFVPFFDGIQIHSIPREIKGLAFKIGRVDLKLRMIHDKMRFNPGHSVKCKHRIEVRDLRDDSVPACE